MASRALGSPALSWGKKKETRNSRVSDSSSSSIDEIVESGRRSMRHETEVSSPRSAVCDHTDSDRKIEELQREISELQREMGDLQLTVQKLFSMKDVSNGPPPVSIVPIQTASTLGSIQPPAFNQQRFTIATPISASTPGV